MRIGWVIVVLGCAVALAGCGRQDRADRAAEEGVLLLGNGAEPKTLDPQLVQSVGDSNLMIALFEGLVSYHPSEDNADLPGVAERWESNEDHTEWAFFLRPDARWSNGDPVTAGDFAYAFERILSPGLGSPYASMLYVLVNARAFNTGEIDDFGEVGVRTEGDWILRLTLEKPVAYLPKIVKHSTWLPVHRPTIEKFGGMTDRFTAWQRPGNHVGNGPFQLKSWRINHSVVVEPNPHYWDAERVKLKEIWFLPFEQFSEERAFRDGLIHITYVTPPNLIEKYSKEKPDLIRREPYFGTYFYRFNTEREPLNDWRVRAALAYCVDQRAIVENITMGGQTPAFAFTPPSEGGYEPPRRMGFDPERARELLAEAGYPDGAGFPRLDLLINTSEAHRAVAEAVQDMWKRELGIDSISIDNQEWKVFQETVYNMDYDICRSGWIADYLDPTSFLYMWRDGDSNNNTGWAHPDYDRLMREAAFAPTAEARHAKLAEAEEIVLRELPVIPIYWYTRVYLKHPAVSNWDPLLLDKRDYKFIRLDPQSRR